MARVPYRTVKEVAGRLKINEAKIRHGIRAGELRAIAIGRGWQIVGIGLAAFLRGHARRLRYNTATGQGPDKNASRPALAGP